MGGGKSSGSTFSYMDMLRMQSDINNQERGFGATKESRKAVENVAKIPDPTSIDLTNQNVPELDLTQNVPALPGTPEVKGTPNLSTILRALPGLSTSLTATPSAPTVSKATKAPGVTAMPKLFTPSEMPVRDAASLLAAKKSTAQAVATRGGRASTILTRSK